MVVEGETWLKGTGQIYTLCHGEVAEWLNAAVSKTVTSVIPASGVRIPPSPLLGATGLRLRVLGCWTIADGSKVRPRVFETRMMPFMVCLCCLGIRV